MGEPKALRDLVCNIDGLGNGNRAGRDSRLQRSAFDALHHQVVGSDVIERADIGMAELRNGASLAREALAESVVADFYGDVPAQAGIARLINAAHSARP